MLKPKNFPFSLLMLALLTLGACTSKSLPPEETKVIPFRPLIVGHRGASGERPEHTRASYELAAEEGADFIEPDLVCTKDGVLIVRHENELSGTTDAASKFPKRRTTKTIDGRDLTGWFAEDFTWPEIQTLRARERVASRDQSRDGQEKILSFDDVLRLREELSHRLGREIGVYPETKHPAYHLSIHCPIEQKVAEALKRFHLEGRAAPVIVQSLDPMSLLRMKKLIDVRLMQLTNRPLSDEEWAMLPGVADIVGPEKRLVIPVENGEPQAPTDFVKLAHRHGLLVHVWTLRSDAEFLPAGYHGDALAEARDFWRAGVDGVFTDFPKDAVKAFSTRL